MMILAIFEVYVLGMFFKFLFYGIITFGIMWLLYKFYQHKKAIFILDNFDKVEKIEFIKPTRQYKTVYQETGYSRNWRYHTTHYKAKRIPKPLIYKGTAIFKSGRKLKFQIIENSEIYNMLKKQ